MMSLSDLASLATVISSLAVLVSLIYVSLQIRQSEKNQRAAQDQGAGTRNIDINIFHADPRINALTTRVTTGDTDFTAEELSLLHIRLRTSILTAQDILVQKKAGLVDKITLETCDAVIKFIMAQPVYRALWIRSRTNYATDVQEYVDKLIVDLPLAHPGNPVRRFHADLDQVMKTSAPSRALEHAPRHNDSE